MMLMYDLPFDEPDQVKQYNTFRKRIKRLGFYPLQYSVYVKVVPNNTNYKTLIRKIYNDLPNDGNIRLIKITEKQYEDMLFLKGTRNLHEQIVGDNQVVVFRENNE